jgi:hypothetical protein
MAKIRIDSKELHQILITQGARMTFENEEYYFLPFMFKTNQDDTFGDLLRIDFEDLPDNLKILLKEFQSK